LRADVTPHIATIARCNCGVIGCGNIEVEIQRQDALVVWQDRHAPRKVEFPATQYDSEVERAIHDFSWETPDRTASPLIRQSIDRTALERRGFKLDWVGGAAVDGVMTVSLTLFPGPYQALVRLPWDGKDIEQIVARFKEVLSQASESWTEAQWHPRKPG